MHREYDDLGGEIVLLHCPDDFQSVDHRHVPIDYCNVGGEIHQNLHGVPAIACFSHDGERTVGEEHLLQAKQKSRMVVGQEDSRWMRQG